AISFEEGRAAASALLCAHPETDGIVCVNDLLAVGALDAVRGSGRRVPDDVQIIGYDDQPLMDVIGLSTVHQPMERFGSWAADALRRLLAAPATQPASISLPLTLVARATTRPQPDRGRHSPPRLHR
ncbi:MAG: substrate-binding domain-containing protein, partial [Planctomycetes bacterium]|nr:substrate-binding domain-containing protein [Planctomycetota bacterium]